jgi:hypothetical protein
MQKKLLNILFSLLWVFSGSLFSQELRCKVVVNSNQIAQVDRSVFDALQTGLTEFMNNTKWTDDSYEEYEKIECQIFINVTAQEKDNADKVIPDRYRGAVTIIAQRRVYNSTYDSPLLNHLDDDFTFQYIPFQQLLFSDNAALSNLTSVFAFYAYMIIGLDMDTFAPEGGTDVLNKALNVVNNAQTIADRGWQPTQGNSNRYWMVNDYLNAAFKPLRSLMYTYHREGFDQMDLDMTKARAKALESLKQLQAVWNQRPNSFLLQLFFNAKRNEILALLRTSDPAEKATMLPVLKKVDPAQSAKYDELVR